MKKKSNMKPVGVIGAGSFGTVVANLIAKNTSVLLYVRNQHTYENILKTGKSGEIRLNDRITVTVNLEELANSCEVIFPVIPSYNFRELMRKLSLYLRPYHILIHGTKGLDVSLPEGSTLESITKLKPSDIKTMSQVMTEESVAVRLGCLAGPNLSRELALDHPAATVVASRLEEVIQEGQRLLRNDRFQVYGSSDIIGIELSGVLKNIIAIASGILGGLGYGENSKSLLISRGLVEMIYIGKLLGGNVKAFMGLAGIGDLIATATSDLSRNYTVGRRLAKGETLDEILATSEEVAEGINTVKIIKRLVEHTKLRAPITETLHNILFKGLDIQKGIHFLMKSPFNVDVDFI